MVAADGRNQLADYRLIMTLLVQRPYRQIEVMAGCSHRAIARARRVLKAQRLCEPGLAARGVALIRQRLHTNTS